MRSDEVYAQRDILSAIGSVFLDTDSHDVKHLHTALQEQIREIYREVHDLIDFTDNVTINDSIARIANVSSAAPPIGTWMPKEYRRNEGTRMECTLGSAMTKLALEEAGNSDVHTAVVKGHQVAIRHNNNGGITIFDPATTHTVEGQIHGFLLTFDADAIVEREDVVDVEGNFRGQSLRVETLDKPTNTGMFKQSADGGYYEEFFVSESDTLVELSVVLENLGDVKAQYTELRDYDADQLMQRMKIFDHRSVL